MDEVFKEVVSDVGEICLFFRFFCWFRREGISFSRRLKLKMISFREIGNLSY